MLVVLRSTHSSPFTQPPTHQPTNPNNQPNQPTNPTNEPNQPTQPTNRPTNQAQQDLLAAMSWIEASTPKDAMFSSRMFSAPHVRLIGRRHTTIHPQWEDADIRRRGAWRAMPCPSRRLVAAAVGCCYWRDVTATARRPPTTTASVCGLVCCCCCAGRPFSVRNVLALLSGGGVEPAAPDRGTSRQRGGGST